MFSGEAPAGDFTSFASPVQVDSSRVQKCMFIDPTKCVFLLVVYSRDRAGSTAPFASELSARFRCTGLERDEVTCMEPGADRRPQRRFSLRFQGLGWDIGLR